MSLDLNQQTVNSYQQHLEKKGASPATINRKMASLKNFSSWAKRDGFIQNDPFISVSTQQAISDKISSLFKKSTTPAAATDCSSKQNWKKAALIVGSAVFTFLLTFNPYTWQLANKLWSKIPANPRQVTIFQQTPSEITTITQEKMSPWIVYYKGELKSVDGSIPKEITANFSLYESQSEIKPLWTSKNWHLSTDKNGYATVPLGDITRGDEQIPSQLFFNYENLYLGITPQGGTELTPRLLISTANLSANSQTLQGWEPAESAGPNTIPVINNQGTLTLAAESPKIKALNDTFSIEGQAIVLKTPFASDGDITLNPDGEGTINLITTNSINDSFYISNSNLMAGSLISGTIGNDNISPYLINLKSGSNPTTKFSIDSSGNTSLTGMLRGQNELTLADSRSQVNLSDSQNTTLPEGANSILGALKNSSLWETKNNYVNPKNNKSVRVYDSYGSKYIDIDHDDYNVNITTKDTGQINIDTNVRLAQGLSVVGTSDLQGNVTLGRNTSSLIAVPGRFSSSLIPQTTNLYDLGSITNYWNNLYATNIHGTIVPPGFTQGSVVFIDAAGALAQDNSNFFWDNTNKRLGINDNTPTYDLDVNGNGRLTGNLTVDSLVTDGAVYSSSGILNSEAALDETRGGTGQTTITTGDLLYGSAADTISKLGIGANNYVLTSNGTIPGWADPGALTIRWNTIDDPDANQSLGMSTHTSTWNWTTGTGANNLFNLTTDAAADGTGALLNIQTGTTSTVNPLRVAAGSTEALYINSSGQVGIGDTTPSYKLDITDSTTTRGINVDNSTALSYGVYSTGTQYGVYGTDGTTSGYLGYNDLYGLYTANDAYVGGTLTAGGLSVAGNIIPSTDNTYDLGSADYRWQDIYLGPTSLNISDTAGTSGAGTDYVNLTLGFSGEQLQLLTSLQGAQATGGNILLQSAFPSGSTTTEAIKLATSTDLGATDELLQIGDSGGDMLTILGNGNVGIGTTNPDSTLHLYSNTAWQPTLKLEGTYNGSARPSIDLYRTKDGGVIDNWDYTGTISFTSVNSAAENISYAYFVGGATDTTDGSEDGWMQYYAYKDGASIGMWESDSDGFTFNMENYNLDFRVDSDIADGALFVKGSSGNVGIGTAEPTHLLELAKTSGDPDITFDIGGTNLFTMGVYDTEDKFRLVAGDDLAKTLPDFSLDSDGNICIGCYNSYHDLTIFDNADNSTLQVSAIDGAADPYYAEIYLQRLSNSEGALADNEWIGSINYNSENDNNEAITFSHTYGGPADVTDGTEDGFWGVRAYRDGTIRSVLELAYDESVFNEDSIDIDFRVESDNDTHALFVRGSDGNVGIGDTDPGSKLSIAGLGESTGTYLVIDANGDVWKESSSLRYKENIQPLAVDWEKILQLNPVSFNYKETGAKSIGYIAEELDRLGLKDLVIYDNDGLPDAIKYDRISLYLLEIVKKQQVEITDLTKEIKTGFLKTTSLLAENITATQAKISQLTTDNLQLTTKLLSPLVETENLMARVTTTNVIKPLSNSDLLIELSQSSNVKTQNYNSKLKIVNNENKEVAFIDAAGNASFSGQLTALEISAKKVYTEDLEARSATVSGKLLAGQVQTTDIQADQGHFRRLFADKIEGLSEEVKKLFEEESQKTDSALFNQYYYDETADKADEIPESSFSGQLASSIDTSSANTGFLSLTSLDSQMLTVSEFLAVLGQASIVDLQVTNTLAVDNSLLLTAGSISAIGTPDNTLYLQPTGGRIDLLAGKVTIDEKGDIKIAGNVYVAGKVYTEGLETRSATVSGRLFADLMSPTATDSAGTALALSAKQRLSILSDSSDSGNFKEVASIDASGSGTFSKIIIASPESTASGFAAITGQITSNATAGKAVLKAEQNEYTIYNSNLTDESLVYITPASDTQNQVLYVKAKNKNYFQVAINQAVDKDIVFNWWIIN